MKANVTDGSFSQDCALSSVVEHYLHTVGVAGSKPAVRTIFKNFIFAFPIGFIASLHDLASSVRSPANNAQEWFPCHDLS